MKSEQIQAVHRKGNLHIKIFGDFDTVAAQGVTSAITEQYKGRGNVFIKTAQMGAVLEAGAKVFRRNMGDCPVHHRNLFMVGKKGMEMVPDGSRVIIPPQKKSKCGNCKNCQCRKGRTGARSGAKHS